jgi:hypothetical protein
MFGTNKAPLYEADAGEGVPIGMRAGETQTAFSTTNLNQSHGGNPLKMIKEYKSATSGMGMSNASTKGYEEMNRFNQIMHEPIENLVANMDHLSRPVSSN